MNKNKIFSAIMRGFEVSGINALSSAARSPFVQRAPQFAVLVYPRQEIIDTRR